VRRWTLRLLALSAFAAGPVARAAETEPPPGRLFFGGGLAILPNQLGTEEERPLFEVGAGYRIHPGWMVEARASAATKLKAIAPSSARRVTRADLNLSWVPRDGMPASPYLTLGLGAAQIALPGTGSDGSFATNGGAGLDLRLSRNVSLRAEERIVGFRVPRPTGGRTMAVTTESFVGLSIVLGQGPSDQDGDGVLDRADRCAGTPAGVPVDAQGCPVDSDGDGVPDGLDRCDGTTKGCRVDASGCPADSDSDGVCDGLDMCPGTPAGTSVDPGGCLTDRDGDGVPDGRDACPDTPRGCTPDARGCPTDSDRDGVCDGQDKCPGTPSGAKVDAGGCPASRLERETELLETGVIRLEDINFDTGRATLRPESYRPLNEVGDILSRWPALRIEIGGHTDAEGNALVNLALSKSRAQAVLDYLLRKFPELDSERFSVAGYGESNPIESNDTEMGRARNRRVEFTVLNPEVLHRIRDRGSNVPNE
jgi:outer membrane protein OmpA-like peptidoglycan-associated protein